MILQFVLRDLESANQDIYSDVQKIVSYDVVMELFNQFEEMG
jgi:hypothetical protein